MQPGDRIETPEASYEVVARLGGGGQGVTWRVRRASDGAELVYKALRVEALADWKGAELFEREIEVLRGLKIDGIPRLVDVVMDADAARVGYIQDLIPGAPLSALIAQQTPLETARFTAYLRRTLELVEALHGHAPPIVHRDITPANILVDGDRLGLIDFGAVKASAQEATVLTSVGTFGYMAPEQTLGRAVPASDLYSVGVTFTALAARAEPERIPIDPDTGRIDVASVTQHLPSNVRDALIALTQPGLAQRPASATDALALLDARPPSALRRLAPRVLVALAALAALAAAGLAVGPLMVALDPDKLRVRGAPTALAFSDDGASLAIFSSDAFTVWDLKTREARCTYGTASGYERATGPPHWSPDGARVWTALYDTRLYAYHADSCQPAQRIAKLGDLLDGVKARVGDDGAALRTPDGEPRIAAAVDGALVVARVHDGAPTALGRWRLQGGALALTTSRDGSTVAALTRTPGPTYRAEVARLDTPGAPAQTTTFPTPSHINGLALSADGRLAAVLDQHRAVVFQPGDAKSARTLDLGRFDYNFAHDTPITFSADGRLLAAASQDTVVVLDPRDNTIVRELNAHRDTVTALAFSADGAWLASGAKDGTVALWAMPAPHNP